MNLTAPDAIVLAAGVACWALAICLLALRVRALNVQVNRLSERLGEVGRLAQDARVLARSRRTR